MDYYSGHVMDFVTPQDGQKADDNNWAYYLGTTEPKSTLSFSNMFTWKGVTFSFMLTGQFGYYVMTDYYDSFSLNTNNLAAYSKRLDRAFEVYDEGYANQTSYSELPLYNDDNKARYSSGMTCHKAC